MNNRNLLLFSMYILLAGVLFSCSKESPVTGDQITSTGIQSKNDVTNNSSRFAPRHYGSIVGFLVPVPIKASIVAFNDQFISEEVICKPDGSFELNNLPAGGYMVKIDYVPVDANDYSSITVPKVVVVANNVTNLGSINAD